MPPSIAKFNVGGTVFEVALSTIRSQPDGMLAKMIDGRFASGKDESGAYFIDRNPEFFNIVLDVHRDNKVYPLSPGVTRERVVAELEFYGLQDFFEGAAIGPSVESKVQNLLGAKQSILDAKQRLEEVSGEFSEWQKEQKSLGNTMLNEALARLCIASAVVVKTESRETLLIPPLQVSTLSQIHGFHAIQPIRKEHKDVTAQIVKIFAQANMKATIVESPWSYGQHNQSTPVVLESAEPDAGASNKRART